MFSSPVKEQHNSPNAMVACSKLIVSATSAAKGIDSIRGKTSNND